VIVPALRRSGVRRLAAVFVSHEDSDHCDAVPDVLEAFPVGEVVVPAGFGGAPAAETLFRHCHALRVPVREVGRGDVWERRDVRVRILHPRRDAAGPAGNVGSIVAHVTLADRSGRRLTMLLPGDLEDLPLDALAEDRTLPPADVLVLAHHGRGDPSPHEALARRLGARTLVASTSAKAGTDVRGALVTGRDGALRLRPGKPPQTFPW
jgi:competence protein ComEC